MTEKQKAVPITFAYHPAQSDCLTVAFHGIVTDQDMVQTWKNFLEGDKWIPGSKILVDLWSSDLSCITVEGIKILIMELKSFLKTNGQHVQASKVAFAAPDLLQYGLANIYKGFGSGTAGRVAVFRDVESALNWLMA